MTHRKSYFVSLAGGLVAMAILAGGLLNTAAASEFYSVTAIATQTNVPQDLYKLSADHISDQLTTEFVEQLFEDLDRRLPTELSQLIAALN